MSRPVERECGFSWALLDPSPEDVAAEVTHRCILDWKHQVDHRCQCGARPGDDVDAWLPGSVRLALRAQAAEWDRRAAGTDGGSGDAYGQAAIDLRRLVDQLWRAP